MSKAEVIFLAKRLTAAQILRSANLPPRLVSIGKEVEARVSKFEKLETKTSEMAVSIEQLLVEARKYVSDDAAFVAFRKRYCPSLGKSRTYELLAIESGRKTVEDIRAAIRRRVAKHRKAKATKSGNGQVSVTPASGDLRQFRRAVLELVLLTAAADPSKFAGITWEADDLVKLGRFLTALADLQKPAGKLRVM